MLSPTQRRVLEIRLQILDILELFNKTRPYPRVLRRTAIRLRRWRHASGNEG